MINFPVINSVSQDVDVQSVSEFLVKMLSFYRSCFNMLRANVNTKVCVCVYLLIADGILQTA